MANSQREITDTMRPNIRISHTLNGRVKDYAAEHGMSVPEAYEEIITAGLDAVVQGHDTGGRNTAPATQVSPPSDIEAVLETWQPDTEADAMRARGESIRAFEWLAEQDEPKKRAEIVDAVNNTELSNRSWWERHVQPGLRRLAKAGAVEYRSGHHDYSVVEKEE